METVKIFQNSQRQTVRMPRQFRFACDRVAIKKVGNTVVLFPPDVPWETLFNALEQFSPDFMEDGYQGTNRRDRNVTVYDNRFVGYKHLHLAYQKQSAGSA